MSVFLPRKNNTSASNLKGDITNMFAELKGGARRKKSSRKASRRSRAEPSSELEDLEMEGGAKRRASRKASKKSSKKTSRRRRAEQTSELDDFEMEGGAKRRASRKASKKSSKKTSRRRRAEPSSELEDLEMEGGAKRRASRKASRKSSKKASRRNSMQFAEQLGGAKKSSRKKSSRKMSRELPPAIIKGNEFKKFVQDEMKLKGGPVLMIFAYKLWNKFKNANPNATPNELFAGAMKVYKEEKQKGTLEKMYKDTEREFEAKKAAKKSAK